MKKFADYRHRPTHYEEGDIVLDKLNPSQFKELRGIHKNSVRKYEGPFKVISKVEQISYKMELPPHFKIHLVFHASALKLYHEDKADPRRHGRQQAPFNVTASHDREIEAIIDYHAKPKWGQQTNAMFLVHWKEQTPKSSKWDTYDDLHQFKDNVQVFLQQYVVVVT